MKKLTDILEELFLPDNTFNTISEILKSVVLNENSHQGENTVQYNCHLIIELARLYEPISQIPKIKNKLTKIIETHIYKVGSNAIERVSGTAINVS